MSEEPYENTLSLAALRSELRHALDVQYGVLHALRDAPRFPDPFVLMHLGTIAKYPEDWNRGKELQRELGLTVIPPKTECELGAGLWERIYSALTQGEATPSNAPSDPDMPDLSLCSFNYLADELRMRGATVTPAGHGGDFDDSSQIPGDR